MYLSSTVLTALMFGSHMMYNSSNTEYMQHVIIESFHSAFFATPWLLDIISTAVTSSTYTALRRTYLMPAG